MANVVLVVLSLAGAPDALDAFRAEALAAHPDGWSMPHGVVERQVYDGANAVWVSKGPQQATLSFLARWSPSPQALDALGRIASRHGVTVSRSLAVEEGWEHVYGKVYPSHGDLWAGEGLMLRRTTHVSESDARLYATCGFVVPNSLTRIPFLDAA